MPPTTTIWKLDPHTLGKHLVLRAYLDAWLPILGRGRRRILLIDGFAGPGEYADGEEGSPIIALNALCEHQSRSSIDAEVAFLFIEENSERAAHLQSLVDRIRHNLPPGCSAHVIEGKFDITMSEALDYLESQARNLAPCFAMIDPFGVSGTPMEVIERIMANPRAEVYVSLMYEAIRRFAETPEFHNHLDELFGTEEWRKCARIQDPDEKKQAYYSLYDSQLRQAGARHVLHFELYQGKRHIYSIFFGTQHHVGSDRMKQAIWKVIPFGDFAFRASRFNQLTMILPNPDFSILKQTLINHYRGKGWISIEEIKEFVASDKTDFHTGQLKRPILVPMEDAGEILIKEGTRKRRHSFPDGTMIRFL
ncbi:MAG: three-Cys-motif partner protein TcmP [Desulfobacteraceae bacterium]|nr:three-Cys-motif partner protein TcmP [Desulfobacteraceae bacterium]